jgi:hypothetical protein|tara:strand:+ start:410 stop:1270 length:861 start_codon:yes stop_codon:yes gene_type:complete
MRYLPGYTIKPYNTTILGEVLFTDGTNNEIRANQTTCEAYGYTYDRASDSCSAFNYSTKLVKQADNVNNKINGFANTTETGTNTVQINGTNNTTNGNNNDCFINGSDNEIANGVNNSIAIGRLADATANNSLVLGGNAIDDTLGERQSITIMFGITTTDASATRAYVNNTANETGFEVPDNTVVLFETQTIGVRVGHPGGGAAPAGSVGDRKCFTDVGTAISKSGTLSIVTASTTVSDVGTTTGWASTVGVAGTQLQQGVTGGLNMTIKWATTMKITQLKALVTIP